METSGARDTRPASPADQPLPGADPPLWTASFILICLSTIASFLAFHSLIPTLPIYIQQFGGGTGIAGLAFGSLTLAAVLIRPVTGWALDTYGRKYIYLAGLFLFFLVTVIFTWMIPVAVLVALRFVQGLGWGILNTASATIASDVVPLKRMGEGIGIFSLTASISMSIAPGLSLWVVNTYSFPVLFIVCSALALAAILLALPIRYHTATNQSRRFRFFILEKTALQPSLVALCFTFTFSSVLSFLPLFVLEQGLRSAGMFFSAVALTTLITRPLSGLIVDRRGIGGYNLTTFSGISAILVAIPILSQTTSTVHLIAGGILYGVGFGFIQPTMQALCIRMTDSSKRGGANATYWSAFDVGLASGSFIWGMAAVAFGYSNMLILTMIPISLGALIYMDLAKRIHLLQAKPQ